MIKSRIKKELTKPFLAVVVAITVMLVAGGCLRPEDLTLEQRSFRLQTQLLCPVCQGQTINESQAQIAQDMRALLQQKLEQGLSDQEILDEFASIYGSGVLATTRAEGFGLAAWITPVFIAVLGIAILALVARDLKRRGRANKETDVSGTAAVNELDTYLKQVEDDLAKPD